MAPMAPQPTTPSVLSRSSTPMKRPRSQPPSRVERSAWGIRRAIVHIIAMVCSAAVTELPWGVFMTTMPRAVAASMSILSTPVPARPTTLRRLARSSSSALTLVAERMARPS